VLTIARAPWPSTRAPVTVVAGRLPLRSWRSVPRVLVWVMRIRRTLRACPGVLGHRLGFDVRACALWTASAWSTRTALVHFERGEVHRRAMTSLRPHVRPSTFVVWTTDGPGLPAGWDEVQRRIAAVEHR
jgi:hypothetical protein